MSITTLRTEAMAALAGVLPLPLIATFEWWSSTPMELRMTLSLDKELAAEYGVADHSTWHFARDLVDGAITNPGSDEFVGEGDVQVRRNDDCLDFALMGNLDRHHHVVVELRPVWTLMLRSFALVPPAAELIDVDEALRNLLGEASC